ncbi:IS630 family transposase [Anoxybacillus ayderensis]|uniref:IS630 family transposase n=1 Tax=Anoxybacillus ayderensis TaxID=265546 RepID=UPI000A07BADE|nr:IS630 family transposase [Anoxybacillus ayderensis]
MSREGIRKLLHRLRLSWTRPTDKLVKGDPVLQAVKKKLEFIKKRITEEIVLLHVDETRVRAYQALRTTWAEVGNQKQVPSYGHHAHVSIFGAVDVQQGDVVFHRASSANAETFLDFLRLLKEKYSDRFIVLVLDNARIHHANMMQALLQSEEGDAFHFIFLPPYSPHLNPIERLKDEVIANVLHKDQKDIAQSITRFEQHVLQHPDEVLRRIGCAA